MDDRCGVCERHVNFLMPWGNAGDTEPKLIRKYRAYWGHLDSCMECCECFVMCHGEHYVRLGFFHGMLESFLRDFCHEYYRRLMTGEFSTDTEAAIAAQCWDMQEFYELFTRPTMQYEYEDEEPIEPRANIPPIKPGPVPDRVRWLLGPYFEEE